MKVWNKENEYDIEAPTGVFYRIKMEAVPKGFEDIFSEHYPEQNKQVLFKDCVIEIERIEKNDENVRKH